MSKSNPITRRNFFQRAAVLGASAAGAVYFAGCDRGGATGTQTGAAASGCDISGLSDAEAQMRASLQYVDQTTNPEQNCLNCGLWVEPEGEGPCGGCELPIGPVHPEGWCTAWVAVDAG